MTDTMDSYLLKRHPTAARPLLGLTVLLVEDSRFASEAVRLMCLRSGARIRRADCIASAHRHLRTYRPSVVIVDLGLPDGSGTELIAELVAPREVPQLVLATSGAADGRDRALAAGRAVSSKNPSRRSAPFNNKSSHCCHRNHARAVPVPSPPRKSSPTPWPSAMTSPMPPNCSTLRAHNNP